ncbi:hypothetical protein ABZ807_22310 [Micromonospora sp. NPDC047548]|uniref:hypothetical protein n=1 Tax=Micromonospora sp. NPDC047548 TaxID=3155624 RepID=UPI0033C3E422
MTVAADAREQRLVVFYAVAVFLSFLAGLSAMAVFFRRERRPVQLAVSLVGAVGVALTLVVNLARGYPIASLAAALLVGGVFYGLWVRAGRPRGVRGVAAEAD